MSNSDNGSTVLIDELRAFLERNASRSSSGTVASNVARGMRGDTALSSNINRVFGSSSNSSSSQRPILPSATAPTARYAPYRPRSTRNKGKKVKTYHMKLAVVDLINEVQERGSTEEFNGRTLLESPFMVSENEQNREIRENALKIIRARYKDYDGDFSYAIRSSRRCFSISPIQELSAKEVLTLKTKSTGILYIMLSKNAEPPVQDEDSHEEIEHEAIIQEPEILHSTPVRSEEGGRTFRRNLRKRLAASTAHASESSDSEEISDGEESEKTDLPESLLFFGREANIRRSHEKEVLGFYNPDGKSCGLTAILLLLLHVKPFTAFVEKSQSPICSLIKDIYQLRGLRDRRISKVFGNLLEMLALPVGRIDCNEFLLKLFTRLTEEEGFPKESFCGVQKGSVVLNSSASREIVLKTIETSEQNDIIVHDLCPPSGGVRSSSLRDILSFKLNDFEEMTYQTLKERYPEELSEAMSADDSGENPHCIYRRYYQTPPQVLMLGLQRGTTDMHRKDNQNVIIPRVIPFLDLKKPENEGVHSSTESGEGQYTLYGMIVHSEKRDHNYAVVDVGTSKLILYDNLDVYETENTDSVLRHLSGSGRDDSSVVFIYLSNPSLATKTPPPPEKSLRNDVIKRRCEANTGDVPIIDIDPMDTPVDYQEMFSKIENQTKTFVGLDLLKDQFLKFAKTTILHEKRKQLGYKVQDVCKNMHFVFQGNPGTGKTTFARKVADLLYTLKRIKKKKVVEVQRDDLVGQFMGSTEAKCEAVIKSARGGVLFIDEAYRLASRSESDYGRIAIDQLMSSMEGGSPVMIFAGYKREMSVFVNANPGLRSRIRYFFDFPDYSLDELDEIMRNKIASNGYLYEGRRLAEILKEHTSEDIRQQQNARFVTNLVSESVVNLSSRLSLTSEGAELITITASDVIKSCKVLVGASTDLTDDTEQGARTEDEERNSPTY